MIRLRLPPPRLPVLLIVVVTVSLGLHHYVFHSPVPQRVRRDAAVPEQPSAAQRKMADGGSSLAKLRSAFDDTAPRGKTILSSNTISKNTVVERSGPEESVLNSSTTTRRQHFTTSQVPPCARSSTVEICEQDNEYDEQIAQAIRVALRNSRVGALLQDPLVSSLLQDSTFTEEDARSSPPVAPRSGHEVNSSAACRSQPDNIVLLRAHDINGTWFHVVNQDNIRQTIHFDKCLSNNQTCELGFDAPRTFKTTCKQMFIYRKKFVLNHNGIEVVEKEVFVPSCCACFISNEDRLESGQK